MNEDTGRHVNTSSTEFKDGVEAGLNSTEDTNDWQAGNDLGQALKDETVKTTPVDESSEPTVPLFMRVSSKRDNANPQDEKDETEE